MRAYERLLDYVKVYTTSDPESGTHPSAAREFDLAHKLVEELKALGVEDARVDEHCYVYGSLPATPGCEEKPALGLIAHMDTAPDASGENVNPILHENYDGSDVTLPATGMVMKPSVFPFLTSMKGETLITTDGTTLLGADDKAGVAEIIEACREICDDAELCHGKISICFTPDEEIGRGADKFDFETFDADFAYTVDGGELGGIEYENFNAAGAKITFNGVNTHPGSAKNKMKNAVLYLAEFINMLPAAEAPAHTENREGFYHVSSVNGNESKATLHMIIRDHNKQSFAKRKEFITVLVEFFNRKYGENTVSAEIKDSYYNMLDVIKEHIDIVERAKKAMRKADVEPQITPIRGGTDGARLSFEGLPCPNLSTGGMNFHSIYEAIPVNAMFKMVEVIKNLVSE